MPTWALGLHHDHSSTLVVFGSFSVFFCGSRRPLHARAWGLEYPWLQTFRTFLRPPVGSLKVSYYVTPFRWFKGFPDPPM